VTIKSSRAPAAPTNDRQGESGPFAIARPSETRALETTLSDALATVLWRAGVQFSFGLVGGTIAAFCESLARTPIRVLHCRHETGACFAAAEAYFCNDRPNLVFTTSGPGLVNAMNGVMAARWEGAKLVLVSGMTPPNQWGKWAFQETDRLTLPEAFFAPGPIFDYAIDLTDPSQLASVAAALRIGLSRPGRFVAHVGLPSTVQTQPARHCDTSKPGVKGAPTFDDGVAQRFARMLDEEPFAVWVGFGARRASTEVRELAERTGSMVMCSPRAKGIFPEDHPLFIGVTGFAGSPKVAQRIKGSRARRALVLGTRLGEFTSFWKPDLVPPGGLIHVDIDSKVPGAAYPNVPTEAVTADVGDFLRAVLRLIPERKAKRGAPTRAEPKRAPLVQRAKGPVRPQALMDAVQRIVVDATDAPILADVGNTFAWAIQLLTLREPNRFRVSVGWGSMGQAAAGALGAALAREGTAVALVGDGALLMQNEINTAVQYGLKAIFVVLNDSQYGMIEQGMTGLHMRPVETQMPSVDFVALAHSLGAAGVAVRTEVELDDALRRALRAAGPFVVDVHLDRNERAPINSRVKELIEQGVEGAEGNDRE
jgi:acetolactate synthase-1/2/3 large subunit